MRQKTPRTVYRETAPPQSSPPEGSHPTPWEHRALVRNHSPQNQPRLRNQPPGWPALCETVLAVPSLLYLRGKNVEAPYVGNDLPALLLRQTRPDRHSFVRVPVLQQPRQFAIGSVLDAIAFQAWP